MLKSLLTYLFIVCFVFVSLSQTKESAVKASLIYKLAQYVEWRNEQAIDTFKFGLITNDTVLIRNFKIISKTAKLRLKPIQYFPIGKNIDFNSVQCVFIDYAYKTHVNKVAKQTEGKDILIITYNTNDLLLSMVNIFKLNNETTFKFEVNKQNLDNNGFIYKPELLFYGGNFVDIKELYISTNRQLVLKNQEIDSLNNDLEKLKIEENKYQKQIENILYRIQKALGQVEYKEQEVDLLNTSINKKDSSLTSLNTELLNQKLQKQKLSSQLKKQTDRLVMKNDSIRQREIDLAVLNKELEEKRNKIKESETVINSQSVKIETQKKGLILSVILGVSLIIIVVLIILALKAKRQLANRLKYLVDKRTEDLHASQEYYFTLFENTPVAICEFDLSQLVEHLKLNKNIEFTDNFILEAAQRITINDANFPALELYDATSKQEFIIKYHSMFNKQSIPGLERLFLKLLNNEFQFEYEISRISLKGDMKHLIQRISDLSSGEIAYKNVLVSMLDITELKRNEQEILRHRNHLEELVKERTKEILNLNSSLLETNSELEEQKEALLNTLTQLKDAQLQLVESEKMASLGLLTAGVAHEINNPVNFISSGNQALEIIFEDIWERINGFVMLPNSDSNELMQKVGQFVEYINSEDYYATISEIIKNMQTGVTRIAEIVNSLQSYSRKSDIDISDFNIQDIIDSALVILKNRYKNRVEIIKTFNTIPQISSSLSKLNQVFVNVFSNAFDAIKNNGIVEVTTNYIEKNRAVEIVVKDSGAGIKEDDLSKIFEAFYTTKEPGKGTGLGMYITYGIVQQLKGTIKINSEIGKGTQVFIYLPLE